MCYLEYGLISNANTSFQHEVEYLDRVTVQASKWALKIFAFRLGHLPFVTETLSKQLHDNCASKPRS